jgi:hypothetical protein
MHDAACKKGCSAVSCCGNHPHRIHASSSSCYIDKVWLSCLSNSLLLYTTCSSVALCKRFHPPLYGCHRSCCDICVSRSIGLLSAVLRYTDCTSNRVPYSIHSFPVMAYRMKHSCIRVFGSTQGRLVGSHIHVVCKHEILRNNRWTLSLF